MEPFLTDSTRRLPCCSPLPQLIPRVLGSSVPVPSHAVGPHLNGRRSVTPNDQQDLDFPVNYLSSGHFVSCSAGWRWLCWLFGSWQLSRIHCFYWYSGLALCKLLSSFVKLMCAFSSRCLNRWSFGNEYLQHELAIC